MLNKPTNLSVIPSFEKFIPYEVSIKNIVLPISRAKKKSFLEALTKYIGDAI